MPGTYHGPIIIIILNSTISQQTLVPAVSLLHQQSLMTPHTPIENPTSSHLHFNPHLHFSKWPLSSQTQEFSMHSRSPSLAVTLPWRAEFPHFTEGESEAESREQAS